MKTRTWILIFSLLMLVCAGLSFLFLNPSAADYAQVYSDGQLLFTLDLRIDQQRLVETARGANLITVQDGQLAVTEASCPDGYCMQRGWCSGGAQIVCLPNRLVIRFTGESDVDAMVG